MTTTTLEEDTEIYNQMTPGTIWIWDNPDYHPYVGCGAMEWLILEDRDGHKFALRSSVDTKGNHHISQDTIELPFTGILYRPATAEERAELMPHFRVHAFNELFWAEQICKEKKAVLDVVEAIA
jgi:hypothetical protein